MIYIAVFIVLGLLLGFFLPTSISYGWAIIVPGPFLLGALVVTCELIKGKRQIAGIRSALAHELDLEPDDAHQTPVLEEAVQLYCVNHQLIFRFKLIPFIIGILPIALPMLVPAAIVYAIR